MLDLLANQSIQISAHQAVSGIVNEPQTLHVVAGLVWVTVEGSVEDHWLSAGESVKLAARRLVVIEADGVDSRINLPGPVAAIDAHSRRGNLRSMLQHFGHPRRPGRS